MSLLELVACETKRFDDELVTACGKMLRDWSPDPAPQWVTCIPSLNHPELVSGFAARLAEALDLPFVPCLAKVRANRPQKEMVNRYRRVKNLDGVFKVTEQGLDGVCLLVDYLVVSRWTFTVASALLRQAGCAGVYPLALALKPPRMD